MVLLPIAFAAEGGHRLPDRRLGVILKEANRTICEGDIGATAMIAAELSTRADVRRTIAEEAASRRRTGGGPGSVNLARFGQHQSRVGQLEVGSA